MPQTCETLVSTALKFPPCRAVLLSHGATTCRRPWGILYVLEGATLGGQVILRRLGTRVGISATYGGRFFASYGPDVGRMWRSYVEVLERFGATPKAQVIEQSAVAAFQAFDEWLSQPKVHPPAMAAGVCP